MIRPHRTWAIFQARQRLRPERLAALFDGVAKPLGRPAMSVVWLARRRLVAIDASGLVAADSVKNPVCLGSTTARIRHSDKRVLPTISSDIRAGISVTFCQASSRCR
jgi:hypothetical protein